MVVVIVAVVAAVCLEMFASAQWTPFKVTNSIHKLCTL
jgi:hypothetical protein